MIRPRGRDVRTGAVRQNQYQMELAFALELPKHFEHLAQQRVVWPGNPNVYGKVSEGGSVSWVPLIAFRKTN